MQEAYKGKLMNDKKKDCPRCKRTGIDPEVEDRFAKQGKGIPVHVPANYCKKCKGNGFIELNEKP